MFVTQREITEAYLRGHDIHAIIQRRARLTALAALGLVLPLALVALYLVKSAVGIDLMPGVHAWELLQ